MSELFTTAWAESFPSLMQHEFWPKRIEEVRVWTPYYSMGRKLSYFAAARIFTKEIRRGSIWTPYYSMGRKLSCFEAARILIKEIRRGSSLNSLLQHGQKASNFDAARFLIKDNQKDVSLHYSILPSSSICILYTRTDSFCSGEKLC
jgi:hypothetical protein